MKTLFIVTGAAGHLGSTIVRMLAKAGNEVRGLVLPAEKASEIEGVRYFTGDVRDVDSMRRLFDGLEDREIVVLHTAGIIDISGTRANLMQEVNVQGTKNVAGLCMEYGVRRMLYVSSVHAIPENDHLTVLEEVKRFSPDWVTGDYAKTKAAATQIVLDKVEEGLDAVIVHPSGILGPYDSTGNHLVQMLKDYIAGKLPACVHGGYDFVDVRDVAKGCLLAVEKGRTGECYILSNRHYEVRDLLKIARACGGGRRLPVLPMWMAYAAAPLLGWFAKLRKQRPLYTRYSLYTLSSNDRFAHDKATAEFNYRPRDLYQTVRDTIQWLRGKRAIA